MVRWIPLGWMVGAMFVAAPCAAQPDAEPAAKHAAPSVTHSFAQPAVLPAAQSSAQPVAKSVAEPQLRAIGRPVPLPDEHARQFDFWLGEWNVQNKHLRDAGWTDSGTARALIQSVAGGAAVLEQWNGVLGGDPLIGFSLRAWDPRLGKFAIWLNWHGGRPSGFSPMHGVRNAERIELFPPGDDTSYRYTFAQAHEGSCQWDEARSSDGGKTWTTRWIMQFARRDEPLPVDATNAPIVEPPASARAFPDTRKLDYLIGAWEGPARVRAAEDATWRDVTARARVTTMIEGLALLQYVDTSDGVKTMAALGSDNRAEAWVALSVSSASSAVPNDARIHYLTAQPAERAVTFTAKGDRPDRREGWTCASDDACTFRRHTSADGGKSWQLVFEARLRRSVSTAAFIDIPRVQTPFPGVLTGGQLSVAALEWAARNGYRTIVNTRAPGEEDEIANEAEIVRGLGMTYVSIPVAGGADVNVANAKRLGQALASDDALPAIVHCRSGNRVGALFALKAHAIDGIPATEALEIGRASGMTGIEPLVREKLGLPAKPD